MKKFEHLRVVGMTLKAAESDVHANKSAYESKYSSGYGLMYPDGHVIRFYEKFLRHELGLSSGRILDLGVGNGCHARYFESKGFEVYGVDMSAQAISSLLSLDPAQGHQFCAFDLTTSGLSDCFPGLQFDLVFSNQVLYYLNAQRISSLCEELQPLMKDTSYVYFTMMSAQNYYYPLSKAIQGDSRRRVELAGRLNEVTDILFMNSEDHLVETFSAFDPLFVGSYDVTMREGSGHHYQYLGKKKRES